MEIHYKEVKKEWINNNHVYIFKIVVKIGYNFFMPSFCQHTNSIQYTFMRILIYLYLFNLKKFSQYFLFI